MTTTDRRKKNRFTLEQKEELFKFWHAHNQDISKTAQKAGCYRQCIYRMIRVGKWKERSEKVQAIAERAAEKRLATEQAKHIDIADFIIDKELAAYKKRATTTGNPFVIATMMKYKDEALADSDAPMAPPAIGTQSNTVNYNVSLTNLNNPSKEVTTDERNRRVSNIIAALSEPNFGS